VILIVSTGRLTDGARKYRERIIGKSPLNIVVIDGSALNKIGKDPTAITGIMRGQARDAMANKPAPHRLTAKRPSASTSDGSDQGEGDRSGSADPIATPQGADAEHPKSTGAHKSASLTLFQPYYSTAYGSMYLGDAYDVLGYLITEGVRVKLLFTSPPFALIRKKAYGNEDQERYVDWFMRFVPLFQQVLEPGGSFVMDIGGSWIPGIPARSVYQYRLLLKLCDSGFYLAQEFYHYNPARLPTPAEWVTIRRLRVKDAMNNVWWFVKEPFVDSDNRRVLREYSESMKDLLRNGYKAKLRPSGHQISEQFKVDRGGSIPPNLLQFANTESNSHYLRQCKRTGVKPHPARFPIGLPDFFIRFLTGPGDMVLDPFAGSNVTGEAAEVLKRHWIGVEISEEYARGSKFRFEKPQGRQAPEVAQPPLPVAEVVRPPEKRDKPRPANLSLFMGRGPNG
jgi:DNA modification methylase